MRTTPIAQRSLPIFRESPLDLLLRPNNEPFVTLLFIHADGYLPIQRVMRNFKNIIPFSPSNAHNRAIVFLRFSFKVR